MEDDEVPVDSVDSLQIITAPQKKKEEEKSSEIEKDRKID